MPKQFILFDFDGVIVDSFQAAYDVARMICPHLTEEQHRTRFEGNIHDWEEPVDRHTKECRQDIDFFAEYMPRLKISVIFPGMREVISGLAKGYTLVIVSSTVSSSIQEYLDSHDLAQYFSLVMGADVHTSKVEKITMVFEKYKIGPRNCVFITDTLGDMHEAEKAGVGAIGVTWGFHASETLERGDPYRLVKSPRDLQAAISDYFAT